MTGAFSGRSRSRLAKRIKFIGGINDFFDLDDSAGLVPFHDMSRCRIMTITRARRVSLGIIIMSRLDVSRRLFRLRFLKLEGRNLPSTSLPLSDTLWTALGPTPVTSGQTNGGFPVSGRASAIAVNPTNPDIVYLGAASGGVWKTTNATAANPSWTPITDFQASLNIGAMALAPSNPNIIYVGTGEANMASVDCFYGKGVLKSTDAGATWALMGNSVFDRTVISSVVINPTDPNTVFVSVGGPGQPGAGNFAPGLDGDPTKPTGIFRTTDGGVTWTNITTAISTTIGFSDVVADPTNPNVLYAGVGVRNGAAADGVYKTTNALAATPTWTLISNIVSGATVGRTRIAVAPNNNQVLYVAMQDPVSTGVLKFYQSTNGGTTWNDRTANLPGMGQVWYSDVLIVDPAASNTVYFAGSTQIVRSTNGGATFSSILSGADGKGPHVDFHAFAFDSAGRFLVGCDGGTFRYTPSTNLWVSLNGQFTSRTTSTALNTIQFTGIAISPTNPDFIIGGTQDNGLLRFNDSLGWTTVEGGDGGDVIIDPFNESRMWRANPVASFGSGAYVRVSTDGGASWSSITNGITDSANAFFYPPMAADPGTNNRIFLGTDVVNVSTDGGNTWGRLPGDTMTFSAPVRAIGIGPASSSTIYVGVANSLSTINNVFVTTNNGATWVDRTPPGAGDYINITVDPTNSNIAYVVSANFSATGDNLWKTTNGGVTWTSISGTLPDAPCYDVVLDPGPTTSNSDDVLYAGGDFGVHRSTDLGTTWTQFGSGLPNCQVRDLEFSPITKILAADLRGRGVWEMLTGTPTTPGVISGTVYSDTNGNGTRNTGEPGLAGWTVFRDDNNNGVIDSVGSSSVTSTNVPMNITDFNTITSTVSFNGVVGAVTDVNVKLNITHTYVGDLVITLADPADAKVTLFSNVNIGGQNFSDTIFDDQAATPIDLGTAPFAGSYQPNGFLGAFNGAVPNGTWTLSVSDVGPGDTGTLNGWTVFLTTGEPTVTSAANGVYQFVNQPAGTYTIRRVLQPGYTATEPISGVQTAVVMPTSGAFALNFGQTNTPAKIASVTVNDGTPQRSRVTQLIVDFNSIVNFVGAPAAAFQLVRTGPGNPMSAVTLAAAVTNVGHTEVVLTFSGPLTEFTSLMDGRYNLTVLASQFAGAGFDGNGDGTAGDNYTVVGAPGTAPNLFRLYGDINGDGTVAANDFIVLRQYFGGYLFAFDFDGDNAVAASDFIQFRLRFGGAI
jgi:subtilisin-like proprotein convertase family protein